MWLIFPLFGTVFYNIGGYIQNYLTDNAIPKKRAGSYILIRIFCHIAALVLLLAVFGRAVFMMPIMNALGMMAAGAINVISTLYYCKALQKGDNADISIFGQVSPLISVGLGMLILQESIALNQWIGFVFIMIAIMYVIMGGRQKGGKKIDPKVALITVVSSFFSVLSDIVYAKYLVGTADYTHFAQAFFFFELGCTVFTILIAIFFESYRKAIKRTFMTGPHHKHNLVYALTENLTFLIAEIFYKLGLLMAPVKSLVSVIGRVVSLFTSMFITIFFGRVFPKFISAKRPNKKTLMRYAVAAVFIIVGLVVMNY
jgi:uncharacterized membrane protein